MLIQLILEKIFTNGNALPDQYNKKYQNISSYTHVCEAVIDDKGSSRHEPINSITSIKLLGTGFLRMQD